MGNKINKILKHTLIFLVVFLVTNQILASCQNNEDELAPKDGNVVFTTTNNEYARTSKVTVNLKNSSTSDIIIPNECPNEPFNVFRYENNTWVQKTNSPKLDCSNQQDKIVKPGEKAKIIYDNWNNALFSEMGRFKITFNTKVNGKDTTLTTNEFLVKKEGLFTQLKMGLFYKPIYNALIFFAVNIPGHHLILAIILLTILIRTILLIPSQKAIRSQKRMQEIQPKLEKIKQKYKGDQQKISMETMAIWKESKVNPLSSCLPMLLQFPFLIGLFYAIKSGLNPDNVHLLYTTYSTHLSEINVNSFGILDLTKPNVYVLPFIVGGLQFIQLKISTAQKTVKNKNNNNKKEKKNETQSAMKMMNYFMPIMIAVFTASLPAGVGVYWGTSTLFAIGQQLVVNKEDETKVNKKTNRNEVKVRVIKNKSSKEDKSE